ncbi:Rv3654c family TadE-like protein [Brevibacterium jeotgali]|uniref:Helicase/secretion neighborhood TadE-like protein n=1 Tax=Brevibacterium jeotgali TaxID=1262550 RepID=A0A2H1L1M3_9MICO|nr:Rv3654c family TadE-like protein [Brevibacterium jeotgali]TWC02024.1 secretion/DNA translocation related TadE-like protein [Brevibacterium jeotgali]SMY10625.1 helicase/secretion neighborhood TadE-like protein [Brevibacterium jeotgali]
MSADSVAGTQIRTGTEGAGPSLSAQDPASGRSTVAQVSDAGSSTVPAVGIAGAAAALALMVGTIGQGLDARARADAAADLAAIAVVQVQGENGCATAEEVAERNGARVSECITRPDLGTATVTVEAPLGIRIPGTDDDLTVEATAVAGRAE